MGRDVHLDGRQHAIDHLLDLGLEAGRREERIELAVADEGRGDRVGVAAVQRRCEEIDVLHLRLVRAVELASQSGTLLYRSRRLTLIFSSFSQASSVVLL